MNDFKNQKTYQHLKESFYRESATILRYLYFAKLAEIEGLHDIAATFRKLAEGGECSAHGHLDFLRIGADPESGLPIGEAKDNLTAALHAETPEYTELYPKMAEIAKQEGFLDIASWFETVTKLKKAHVAELNSALEQVKGPTKKIPS